MTPAPAESAPVPGVRASRTVRTPAMPADAALAAGFRPSVWLGAPAPGGLALPSAAPAADTMYAPRGVWFDDGLLAVADSGNHRVLLWHRLPTRDHAPADLVLGQADFAGEGPKSLHLPTGVAVIDGRLIVADAWHHRLLIWNSLPTSNDQPADAIIGQANSTGLEPNRGDAAARRDGFYWPYGFGTAGGRFFVADTGNRRVLAWPCIPGPNEPPRWLIGQPDWTAREENAGGPVGPTTFRWPHAIAGDDRRVFIADAGNHRVLGWLDAAAACEGDPPDLVLGQQDFTSAREWPYGPQAAGVHRFPYDLSLDAGRLAVSDTANNRVLLHTTLPGPGAAAPAEAVLAQPDFASNGENRWQSVQRDTLCWPYGLHLRGQRLAVADSGNNRVMLWTTHHPTPATRAPAAAARQH